MNIIEVTHKEIEHYFPNYGPECV